MKKASIVAMIAAAVIMIGGLIVCAVGSSVAKDSNYLLFPKVENGESVYRYDVTGHDLNRISVSVGSANVRIKSEGTESYIEVRNYNANNYRLNEENKNITFSEVDDIWSMLKFWEGGISFKGMRYIFASGVDGSKSREVIINIAKSDAVRSLVVSVAKGDAVSSDFLTAGDISLSVTEGKAVVSGGEIGGTLSVSVSSGESSVKNCRAVSAAVGGQENVASLEECVFEVFKWNGDGGKLSLTSSEIKDLSALGATAEIGIDGVSAEHITVNSGSGHVRINLPDPLAACSADVTSKSGTIFVGGTQYQNSCILHSENAVTTVNVTTDSGAVEIDGAAITEEE